MAGAALATGATAAGPRRARAPALAIRPSSTRRSRSGIDGRAAAPALTALSDGVAPSRPGRAVSDMVALLQGGSRSSELPAVRCRPRAGRAGPGHARRPGPCDRGERPMSTASPVPDDGDDHRERDADDPEPAE